MSAGFVPSKDSEGQSSPYISPGFWRQSQIFSVPCLCLYHSNLCLFLHMVVFLYVSIFLWHSPFYVYLYPVFPFIIRPPVIGLRAHFFQYDLNLANYICKQHYFQVKSHSEGLEVRTSKYLFGKTQFNTYLIYW